MNARPNPERILVRGVNWLGDAVMTTPALHRLRERFPHAEIALLTQRRLADLYAQHPALNQVLAILPGQGVWSVARTLRPHSFDLALILPNSPRSALESWLASIPRRVGYARPGRTWLLTEAVAPRPGSFALRKRSVSKINRLLRSGSDARRVRPPLDAHQLFEYLHLVSTLGADREPLAPQLFVTPGEKQAAEKRALTELASWSTAPLPARPTWLGLTPSAAYGPAKCWPANNFARVVREVSGRLGNVVWLLFGQTGDGGLCTSISELAGTRCLNLAGRTSLRELMALLSICQVLVTNDSGPMHAAAALGTKVVALFGSTSPELTGPGLPGDPRHRSLSAEVPCAPCFRRTCPVDLRCMSGLTVSGVVDEVCRAVMVA